MKTKIIEIFSSIQGEGAWVGRPQIFVRFHGCSLNCQYCDTPLTHYQIKSSRIEEIPFKKGFIPHSLEYTPTELTNIIDEFHIPSLALTGGEPLEHVDFLFEWLPSIKNRFDILLETNGIEVGALLRIVEWIDVISMDIKLPSSTREIPLWERHEAFIEQAKVGSLYAKIVYDETMTDDEMERLILLAKKYGGLSFFFQPVSPIQKRDLTRCLEIFSHFASLFPKRVRLIPQIHKFLGIY